MNDAGKTTYGVVFRGGGQSLLKATLTSYFRSAGIRKTVSLEGFQVLVVRNTEVELINNFSSGTSSEWE